MASIIDILTVARNYAAVETNWRHFCGAFNVGCTHWCAYFVSVCAKESGCGDICVWNGSCNQQISWWKDHGLWSDSKYDIEVGDWIYYDWDHADYPPADHVGIVEKVNGNEITVIEGNRQHGDYEEDPCDTHVGRRVISKGYYCIFGRARPRYDGSNTTLSIQETDTPTIRLGSKGEAVSKAQRLLIERKYDLGYTGADGDFGEYTEKAVKAFQEKCGLEVDGVIGPKTWEELVKPIPLIMRGDTNNDGVIDGKDVEAISKKLLGDDDSNGEFIESYDVNGDGTINACDLAAAQQLAVGFTLPTVVMGQKHWAVLVLQNELKEQWGLDFSEEGIDGTFTDETAYNLNYACGNEDLDGGYGICGPRSWAKILKQDL